MYPLGRPTHSLDLSCTLVRHTLSIDSEVENKREPKSIRYDPLSNSGQSSISTNLLPVLISLAASATTSSVRRFRVPSSSSLPYSPHAEWGGSSSFKGSSESFGMPCGGIIKLSRPVNLKELSLGGLDAGVIADRFNREWIPLDHYPKVYSPLSNTRPTLLRMIQSTHRRFYEI